MISKLLLNPDVLFLIGFVAICFGLVLVMYGPENLDEDLSNFIDGKMDGWWLE